VNKEQRQPYLVLSEIYLPQGGFPILCSFCKYGECYCTDCYCECTHPIDAISDNERHLEYAQTGGDCWGFRPTVKREDAVDIVGIWLTGKAAAPKSEWATN